MAGANLSDSELRESLRYWLRTDLWFFLRFALNPEGHGSPVVVREVQGDPGQT
jgi:hypothetical protein